MRIAVLGTGMVGRTLAAKLDELGHEVVGTRDPGRAPGEHNVFLRGIDETAKQAATGLIRSFGWPAGSLIDLGDISAARGTEMLLPLWPRLMGPRARRR
jgi:predicted dinucleotide-binding enzyme